MKGIMDRLTPDGIRILRVHYTADPDKNPQTPKGAGWLARESIGYPNGVLSAKWRKEMDIDPEAQGGQLAFPLCEVNAGKIFIPAVEIPVGWQFFGGFDYATRGVTAAVVIAASPSKDKFVAVWEYYKKDSGYIATCDAIKACPYYSLLEWIVADPSIWSATQQKTGSNELTSVAQLFAEQGLHLVPGSKGRDLTFVELVNDVLWADIKDNPKFFIFTTCDKLWWEIKKQRYNEWSPATAVHKNLKETLVNKDNHAVDCIKYVFMRLFASWMSQYVGGPEAI